MDQITPQHPKSQKGGDKPLKSLNHYPTNLLAGQTSLLPLISFIFLLPSSSLHLSQALEQKPPLELRASSLYLKVKGSSLEEQESPWEEKLPFKTRSSMVLNLSSPRSKILHGFTSSQAQSWSFLKHFGTRPINYGPIFSLDSLVVPLAQEHLR